MARYELVLVWGFDGEPRVGIHDPLLDRTWFLWRGLRLPQQHWIQRHWIMRRLRED